MAFGEFASQEVGFRDNDFWEVKFQKFLLIDSCGVSTNCTFRLHRRETFKTFRFYGSAGFTRPNPDLPKRQNQLAAYFSGRPNKGVWQSFVVTSEYTLRRFAAKTAQQEASTLCALRSLPKNLSRTIAHLTAGSAPPLAPPVTHRD